MSCNNNINSRDLIYLFIDFYNRHCGESRRKLAMVSRLKCYLSYEKEFETFDSGYIRLCIIWYTVMGIPTINSNIEYHCGQNVIWDNVTVSRCIYEFNLYLLLVLLRFRLEWWCRWFFVVDNSLELSRSCFLPIIPLITIVVTVFVASCVISSKIKD